MRKESDGEGAGTQAGPSLPRPSTGDILFVPAHGSTSCLLLVDREAWPCSPKSQNSGPSLYTVLFLHGTFIRIPRLVGRPGTSITPIALVAGRE